MKNRSLSLVATATLAIVSLVISPASATPNLARPNSAPAVQQTPKPPTDARKTVYGPKRGTLAFTAEESKHLTIPTTVKDFDALATFTNPSTPEWIYGFEFRYLEDGRSYVLFVTSLGEAAMMINRADGNGQLLKEATFSEAVRKNSKQTNDLALYVRADQALLFINRKFVDSWAVGEVQDAGELSIFAGDMGKVEGSTAYRNFTVKVSAGQATGAAKPTPAPAAQGAIVASMYRSGYERHGRPAGMDDAARGCGDFDDSRPVNQFQAVLKIENRSSKPMKAWYPVFIKSGGAIAYTCYYEYLPEIPPGESRDVTFGAFLELNERMEYMVILDKEVGASNRLLLP